MRFVETLLSLEMSSEIRKLPIIYGLGEKMAKTKMSYDKNVDKTKVGNVDKLTG